jgi:hypothetical protein
MSKNSVVILATHATPAAKFGSLAERSHNAHDHPSFDAGRAILDAVALRKALKKRYYFVPTMGQSRKLEKNELPFKLSYLLPVDACSTPRLGFFAKLQ